MTSRERVRAVLRGQIPDRVPRALYDTAIGIHNPEILKLFDKMTGKHPREVFSHDLLGVFSNFALNPDLPEYREAQAAYERSSRAYRPPDSRWVVPEDVSNPDFRRLRVLCCYEWQAIQGRFDEIHAADRASVLVNTRTLLESACCARGREQFYMDLAYQEDWLEPFLDILTDAAVEEIRALLSRVKPDIFCYGDDVGAQKGLIISPAQWNRLFKPRHRRIVQAIKDTSPETAVAFHCCGDSRDLIEPLIEIGVDILNPIQPAAIDPAEARARAGNRLVLWGGICVQHTLPHGTPEDIHREVQLRMETIGKEGRYILSPAHLLNADIPWKNIAAFFEAADRYGRY